MNDFSLMTLKRGSLIAGILILGFIVQAIATYLLEVIGNKVTRDIRQYFWCRMLYGKVSDLDEIQSGELSSRLMNDTLAIATFISFQLPNMVFGIVRLVVALGIMFYIDYVLTLTLLSIIPCVLIVIFPISQKIHALSEKQQTLLGEGNSYFTERFSQIKLIKAYGAEKQESRKGSQKIATIYTFENMRIKITAALTPLLGFVVTLLLLSTIAVGLYRVNLGYVTAGTLVAFLLYFYEAMTPIQTVGSFIVEIKELKGRTEQFFSLLEKEVEQFSTSEEIIKLGDLSFQHIYFRYQDEVNVLQDISFVVKEGKQTAIVGESGSGKTTLIALLERFYLPIQGTIRIANQAIHHLPLDEWRKLFSYVSQDAMMISSTIRENMIFGIDRPVTDEELVEIAKQVDVYDDIIKLPHTFDTYVGERGMHLSGGQRQRIAIARALIRNPKYLLLDEATANLDAHTEENVQQSIQLLLKGRTSIVIAHRLSTIVHADHVIVLQNGKVTGQGTHQELLQHHHYYQELVKKMKYDD